MNDCARDGFSRSITLLHAERCEMDDPLPATVATIKDANVGITLYAICDRLGDAQADVLRTNNMAAFVAENVTGTGVAGLGVDRIARRSLLHTVANMAPHDVVVEIKVP